MEEKVSVIIPNYNGLQLLAKNLPGVIENCPGCEIIVVDDASDDDSVEFLRKNFRKIKTLVNTKNQGFSKTVNKGVQQAEGKYVLLLNTDVAPRKNFLENALATFKKDSTGTFAVGLADYSHEGSKIVIRGRGGANFKKGFVNHFALSVKEGETLWVSGGSSLIDRAKFNKLGGFDSVYAPFYWEDIDLSYRARKAGYKCLFETTSKVDHHHDEGAIKNTKSQFYIKSVAYKNQFLFVWINIEDYLWIVQHIIWLPYHAARALASGDWAFFTGFLWAISKIPQLVLRGKKQANNLLTDKEILGEST